MITYEQIKEIALGFYEYSQISWMKNPESVFDEWTTGPGKELMQDIVIPQNENTCQCEGCRNFRAERNAKEIKWCECEDTGVIDKGGEHFECYCCGLPYPRYTSKHT